MALHTSSLIVNTRRIAAWLWRSAVRREIMNPNVDVDGNRDLLRRVDPEAVLEVMWLHVGCDSQR